MTRVSLVVPVLALGFRDIFGGDMFGGDSMFGDMDKNMRSMEQNMDKDFSKMNSNMATSTGTGLSVENHDGYMEVKGQLEKGLKVCSAERTKNCIQVSVESGE